MDPRVRSLLKRLLHAMRDNAMVVNRHAAWAKVKNATHHTQDVEKGLSKGWRMAGVAGPHVSLPQGAPAPTALTSCSGVRRRGVRAARVGGWARAAQVSDAEAALR